MSPALSWEAQDPETMAYFHVVILDMHSGRVFCQFDENWKKCWVEAVNVRPILPSDERGVEKCSPGQTIEVHIHRDQSQPLGWWKAIVKNVKQNVACVQFLDNGECDLVDFQEIRLPKNHSSIDLSRYKKMEMTLPANLTFAADSPDAGNNRSEVVSILSSVRDRCSLVAISYLPAKHQIIVIGDDTSLELSRPVIDMAVAQKGQLQQMRRTTEDLMRELSRITLKERRREKNHDNRHSERNGDVVEEFKLDPGLIGAVIGRGGNRINKVQSMPGIVKINIDAESATVTIVGDSKSNVFRAREALELVESRVMLPSESVDAAHEIVKEIESRSNLQRIRVEQPCDEKSSSLCIVITGKKASVKWAVGHIRQQIGM